jgi:tRNA U34 5-carboxymethylaminomethyl modifying GTPase MnmE/TrmE
VRWFVRNKIDLISESGNKSYSFEERNEWKDRTNDALKVMVKDELIHRNESTRFEYESLFDISARDGAGLDRLLAALARFASQFLAGTESGLITRERHRQVLTQAQAALRRAFGLSGHEDLLAEELRAAAAALGRLTGRVDVEDILDVIFRDFCIGK